jgi:hypothetical protein
VAMSAASHFDLSANIAALVDAGAFIDCALAETVSHRARTAVPLLSEKQTP